MKPRNIRVSFLSELDELSDSLPSAWPLEPRGWGTKYIEAFTGYWSRLAETQWMSTHHFNKHVMLPNISPEFNNPLHISPRSMFPCNGYGRMALRAVSGLNAASGLFDSKFLTFIPWKPVINPQGNSLVRRHLNWCTCCWKNDEATGRRPYLRLSWVSPLVEACTVHNRSLQSSCPHCGRVQDVLAWFPRIWICQACGGKLHNQDLGKALSETASAERFWVARAIEALIEKTCGQSLSIPSNGLKKAIELIVNKHFDGNYSRMARSLNLKRHVVRSWSGKTRPGLPVLLDFCYRIDIPPDKLLLTENGHLTEPNLWRKINRRQFVFKKFTPPETLKEINKVLDEAINDHTEPPTMISDICRSFDVAHNLVNYHFPEKYQIVKDKSESWKQQVRNQDRKRRIKAVTEGALQLMGLGIYPSDRKLVEYKFVRPSDLRRQDVVEQLRSLQDQYTN